MTAATEAIAARRSVTIITLVGAAHFCSHLMQLAVPPLFPVLHEVFGASFVELGMIVTLFYGASGLGQAAAGFLVDRFGAVRVLLAGLALLSLSTASVGLVPDYRMVLLLAFTAGLGNSVFHPSDLSILSHRVSERLLGRAFAVHGLAGALGYAVAPALVGVLASLFGWRVALVAIGGVGLGVAVLLYATRAWLSYERELAPRRAAGPAHGSFLAIVFVPVVMLAFAYFVITSWGATGMQTFSVAVLSEGYGLALPEATLLVTFFLVASAVGTIVGGFIADRTSRHHRVAMTGLGVTGAIMAVFVFLPAWPWLLLLALAAAGLANGTTGPSRDVIVRRAARGVGTGSVFGLVYSGGDLGSAVAPLLFGWLGDHHLWRMIFLVCALSYIAAVPTVMQVERRGAARAQPAGE